MKKLEFELIELKNQKPIKTFHSYIILQHLSLVYAVKFIAEEPKNTEDHLLGIEEITNDFETMALKSQIVGIEKQFIEKEEIWKVMIFVNGFPNDLKVFFKKETKAVEFYQHLENWLQN